MGYDGRERNVSFWVILTGCAVLSLVYSLASEEWRDMWGWSVEQGLCALISMLAFVCVSYERTLMKMAAALLVLVQVETFLTEWLPFVIPSFVDTIRIGVAVLWFGFVGGRWIAFQGGQKTGRFA